MSFPRVYVIPAQAGIQHPLTNVRGSDAVSVQLIKYNGRDTAAGIHPPRVAVTCVPGYSHITRLTHIERIRVHVVQPPFPLFSPEDRR